MEKEVITVDIVSDVACPWCYVGKRKFEAALEKWNGAPIEVTWRPYQLDPSLSLEGVDRDAYLINKFGSLERTKGMTDRLTEVGKEVGINFDFGRKWLAFNTLQMHQLLHVAGQEGFQNELKERFLNAYFEETEALNQPEVLHAIMADFGWSEEKVDQIIHDQEIAQAVKDEIVHFQSLGVSGVPFFIINNKYGISGAQPSDVFLEAFQSVSPLEISSDGDSCDPVTGEC
jgi:predicted DsbA family dithiol-disulfide isomerase